MTQMRVNGIETILTNTVMVREMNKSLWQLDATMVKNRLRGNGWTIFRRLLYDYRNHFGNTQRAKNRQMPYVDTEGYLFTSPALIAHAEGKSMGNLTVSRWLERLQKEFDFGTVEECFFVLSHKQISRDCIRLKLNQAFFVLENQNKDSKQDKSPKKPPETNKEHIDVSKLAKKFNRKHHVR